MSQIIPDQQPKTPFNSSTTKPSRLGLITKPIERALNSVNQLLGNELINAEPHLRERLEHSGLAGGKRIRPILLLLSGACFGDLKKTHIYTATSLELVHAATLLHDDVLDDADARRHARSMHRQWDKKTSILSGDYLFSKAFEYSCQSGSLEVTRSIAESSCNVCSGEIRQNATAGHFEMTEEDYVDIIDMKTAELCRCACGLGALLSECDEQMVAAFETFGRNLGIAFQIIDDILDLIGEEGSVGKTLGTDLKNSKPTLPVIHCLATINPAQRQAFVELLSCDNPDLERVMTTLNDVGSIEYSRQTAREYAEQAYQFARTLPDSEFADALIELAAFVINRTH